jgi:uroporphyrinogen-III synthase
MGALTGKRVVNTRATHQAAELDRLLRQRGAIPLAYPCVDIVPPQDSGSLEDALARLAAGGFDWLVLTSANTVEALGRLLRDDSGLAGRATVAAVGPATAAAARRLGLDVAVVPERHDGAALAKAILVQPGERVFLPGSEIARPELAAALTERGAAVTAVTAYRTVVGTGGVDLPGLLRDGGVDAAILASSSATEGLVERLNRDGGTVSLLDGLPLVCIGERTRETALKLGLVRASAAERATLDGLIEVLERVLEPTDAGVTRWSRAS